MRVCFGFWYVLLLPDITKSAADHDDIDPDELHRLFYFELQKLPSSCKNNCHYPDGSSTTHGST